MGMSCKYPNGYDCYTAGLTVNRFEDMSGRLILERFGRNISTNCGHFVVMNSRIKYCNASFNRGVLVLLSRVRSVTPRVSVTVECVRPSMFIGCCSKLGPCFTSNFVGCFYYTVRSTDPSVLGSVGEGPSVRPFVGYLRSVGSGNFGIGGRARVLINFPGRARSSILTALSYLVHYSFSRVGVGGCDPEGKAGSCSVISGIPRAIGIGHYSVFEALVVVGGGTGLCGTVGSSVVE